MVDGCGKDGKKVEEWLQSWRRKHGGRNTEWIGWPFWNTHAPYITTASTASHVLSLLLIANINKPHSTHEHIRTHDGINTFRHIMR